MNAFINDTFRLLISICTRSLGAVLSLVQLVRLRFFEYGQSRLRRSYGITDQTPILSYGSELKAFINAAASMKRGKVRFPVTSGSTGIPKRVLFTNFRLRLLKLIFTDFFVRCCWVFSIPRTSLYVFSSFSEDASLTSMLLEEQSPPTYFSTLQAPYRIQRHASLKGLVSEYGMTAVRLWILTLSNPGVLYSTNPSTISTFFDELECDWQSTSRLVRDWHHDRQMFDRRIRRIARQLNSRGSRARLRAVATSATAVSLGVYAPAITTYICWTGGYVKPFLKRLENHLPPARYRLIPMYSISTETVETIAYTGGGAVNFFPIAPGVLYEFVEENRGQLLKPHQLVAGQTYSLIVSDSYGLRRYDTGDVFLCREQILGLPDLIFLRRRNLEYSFTGEKLTAQQISSVFDQLRAADETLRNDHFLTCIPSQPFEDAVPHYKLMLVSEEPNAAIGGALAIDCDRMLAELNCEYKSKRESGRLGPVRFVSMNQADFINLMRDGDESQTWESQFKFLPLYVRTWETLNVHSQYSMLNRSISTARRLHWKAVSQYNQQHNFGLQSHNPRSEDYRKGGLPPLKPHRHPT